MSQPPVPNPPNPVPAPAGTGYSGMYTYYRIIKDAMFEAGYLDMLEDPSADDLAQYLPRFNNLVNLEQTQGLKLWLQEDVSFTPVQGQQSYAMGPSGDIVMTRPTRVIEAYFMLPTALTGGQQIIYPLIPMSRSDWDMIGARNPLGITNSYFIDKQQNNLIVWIWLNPDAYTAQATVHLICQVQTNGIVSVTDVGNFPVEWGMYFTWAMADEICNGQPLAIQQKCKAQREYYRQFLEGFDVEDVSTSFVADPRIMFERGRFV